MFRNEKEGGKIVEKQKHIDIQKGSGTETSIIDNKEQVLLNVLKFLLLASVAMQMFLSVYAIYSNGTMDPTYYALSSNGNLLNICLLVVFFVYLFVLYYIWGQRDRIISKIREYLRVENLLLAGVLVWMYLSGLYHLMGNPDVFSDNSAAYSNALLKLLLFFLLGQYLDGDRKRIHFLFNGLVILMTIFEFYVLVMLVFHSEFRLLSGGTVYFSGEEVKRLCINSNSNFTGMYAKTVFMLCVYLFVAGRRKYRWIYSVAAVVHYMILNLSASRAAIISGAVGISAVVMLAAWRKFRDRKLFQRVLITLGSFGAIFLLFFAMRIPTVGVYNAFRAMCAGQEEIVLRKMGTYSSGRMILYRAAIQSVRDPEVAVFGVTPSGVPVMLDKVTGFGLDTYTHNEFLEIMCSIGIPGLLFFLVWVFCIARKGWIICYDREKRFSMQEGALAIVCFAEILNNMLEARLTFFIVLSGMIFYLTAGFILTDERKRRQSVS